MITQNKDAKREAEEIKRNARAAYKRGEITLDEMLAICRRAEKDTWEVKG
jgi:hypothetical protein